MAPIRQSHPGARASWDCPLPSCADEQTYTSPTAKAASSNLNTHLHEEHGGLAGVAAVAVAAYRRSPTDAATLDAVRDLEALLADRYPTRLEAAARAN